MILLYIATINSLPNPSSKKSLTSGGASPKGANLGRYILLRWHDFDVRPVRRVIVWNTMCCGIRVKTVGSTIIGRLCCMADSNKE
jgi:hypothetical protein